MQSVPFVDLFNLMTRQDQQKFWGESVVKLHKALRAESPGTEPVRKYARQVNVDKDLIPHFLIVYWIRQCLLLLRSDVPQLAFALEEAIRQPLVHFRAG
jgi:hypothetical protein